MTKKGTVVKSDRSINTLLVLLENEKGCSGCEKEKKGCSFSNSCPIQTINAVDGCGARPGDRVMLKASNAKVLLCYTIVFLLPLLIAFVGAFALYGVAGADIATLSFLLIWAGGLLALRFTAERCKALHISYVAVSVLPKSEEAGYER
ncbi:MAG: SoxR reducing system RseC family protein [Clostridia bacterium]|nr:SoxR reducing system RseC family protein [Clostridia bacterium]